MKPGFYPYKDLSSSYSSDLSSSFMKFKVILDYIVYKEGKDRKSGMLLWGMRDEVAEGVFLRCVYSYLLG